jgi:hypothetical protein
MGNVQACCQKHEEIANFDMMGDQSLSKQISATDRAELRE